MAVGMRRVRRQNDFNGRGGRAEPKDRVALLCLVVYSIAIHARPPVLSIKASAMVRARAVSSLHDRAGRENISRCALDQPIRLLGFISRGYMYGNGLVATSAHFPAIEIDVR